MKTLRLHELVRLPEEAAVKRYLDGKSYRFLMWVIGGIAAPAGIAMLVFLAEGNALLASLWTINVATILAIVIARRAAAFERAFRPVLIGYLLLQFAVLALVSPQWDVSFSLVSYVFPLVLPFFRLRRREYVMLLGGLAVGSIWFLSVSGTAKPVVVPTTIAGMALGAIVVFVGSYQLASRWTDHVRRRFLVDWRREVDRDREQLRMREELADARAVQLSMLPSSAPQLSWLELASLSEPATEVGGDYFDHVELPGDRLALVVGDVAGHGMASGLLLAAVRGGLHLLREELTDPVAVIERLDSMVQAVGPQRMYVTLQIALLDWPARKVTVVSAGHPPLLHYSADSKGVAPLGSPATPLGVRLESRLTAETARLAEGDALVLYSDGVLEVTDGAREAFGEDRLRAAVVRHAQGSALELRDAVVGSVDSFRGASEALDDVTLVTAKVG